MSWLLTVVDQLGTEASHRTEVEHLPTRLHSWRIIQGNTTSLRLEETNMDNKLAAILALYDDTASLKDAYTIPALWYIDADIERLEQKRVFGESWQAIGRTEQLMQPGDYITAEFGGEPILAVCGTDGILRAFFNVCRHHAAAVATAPCGRAKSFRCPYHGWNYGLDGSLKGMPEFTGVCNFDPSANGLMPVAIDTWENFVFVNLTVDPEPLQHYLSGLVSLVSPLGLTQLQFHSRKEYTLNCNWKVYVDNYLDGGYHVPHLHKGLNSVLDYSHYTIENGEHFCLQSSPMVISNEDAQVSATRKGDRARYFWIYPNFMINIYEGVMDTNSGLFRAARISAALFSTFTFPMYPPHWKSKTTPASLPVRRCKTKTLPSVSPYKRALPRAPTEPAASR